MGIEDGWYVVRQAEGHCDIWTREQLEQQISLAELEATTKDPPTERWGPFASQAEAIARRVGLIRANKCKPI